MRSGGSPSRGVAVVTGASAGVGRASAHALADRGFDVALLARGRTGLAAAEREVHARGVRAIAIPTDVAEPAQVRAAAERVEGELGPIEIWVNSAMVTVFGRFVDISPEDFGRVTSVTYLGSVNGIRAALDAMRPRNRGTIVQVGSGISWRGIPLQSAYSGAKHAIEGLVEAVREELIHDRSAIELCLVQLPALNTPQFEWGKLLMDRRPQPVPPILQPEVAAEAVAWLAEHPRKELWVDRSTVRLALADRIAPRLLDRAVARRAWDGQLTEEPATAAPDNLWEPVEVDLGIRGRFDPVAKDRRLLMRLAMYRRTIAAGFGVALLAVLAGRLLRWSPRS